MPVSIYSNEPCIRRPVAKASARRSRIFFKATCSIALAAVSAAVSGHVSAATSSISAPAIAKADGVAVPNSYRRTVTSKVNGITYKLTIFLPKGYDPDSAERYPVFYFVPGDAFGVYFSQIARFLASGDIPKLIIVGVDFPPDQSYSMDLPTAGADPHWNVPANRGAANFLKIMKTEIKPYIDAQFPTDPADTGIGGHSLGAFFALYALFQAPETFTHVYASSPSLVWQDFVLLREEAALSRRARDLPARVFVNQGEMEGDDGRLAKLDAAIRSRRYPSLSWQARRTLGQTHQTIAFADGIDALYFIYGPRLRRPDAAELSTLAGKWESSDGRRFCTKARAGNLYLVDFDRDEPRSVQLISAEKDHWFLRYLWHRFDFTRGHGEIGLSIHLQDTPGPNGEAKSPELTARRVGACA